MQKNGSKSPKNKNQNKIWDNISIKDHPLDGMGNPSYKKYDPILSVYKYSADYRDPVLGKIDKSENLFSKKYKWRMKGLSIDSRFFAVWSNEKIYKNYFNSLYKTAKSMHNRYRDSDSVMAVEPEDYVAMTIGYFIKSTEKCQLEYNNLIDKIGYYSHYPLDDTYKSSEEIGLGVMKMYNQKLKSNFTDALRRRGPVPQGNILNIVNSDQSFTDSVISIEQEVSSLPYLKKKGYAGAVFYYLALGSLSKKEIEISVKEKFQIAGNDFKYCIQRAVHEIKSDIIYRILSIQKEICNHGDIEVLLIRIGEYLSLQYEGVA